MDTQYARLLTEALGKRGMKNAPLICTGTDAGVFVDAVAEADVLIAMRWTKDSPPAPRLRLLHLPGAGTDNVDMDALPQGCAVCNAYEHEVPIAEYCMLAMLEHEKGLSGIENRFRKGDWSDSLFGGGNLRGELAGKVLGILGYGRIGRALAPRAAAFGMKVHAITRTPRKDPPLASAVSAEKIHEAVASLDYLVAACPLTSETQDLVDAAVLARMKGTAMVINVGRGAVINEDDLHAALANGIIGGAAIDVWYCYPALGENDVAPSRHNFAALPNVRMTPHISAWSAAMLRRRFEVIADNIFRLQRGEPLQNLVTG